MPPCPVLLFLFTSLFLGSPKSISTQRKSCVIRFGFCGAGKEPRALLTLPLSYSPAQAMTSEPERLLLANSVWSCMLLGELMSLGVGQCPADRTLTVTFLKLCTLSCSWGKDTKRERATSGLASKMCPFASSDGSVPYCPRKLALVCAPVVPATQKGGRLELRSMGLAWVIQQDLALKTNQKHALGVPWAVP